MAPAGPLPSRLDLTGGWPPAPAGQREGDWAPWAQFLPSRDEFGLTLGQGDATEVDLAAYAGLGYTSDQGESVVMYVRSPLASFWRGYTLDVYDGRGWVASSAAVQFQVDRQGRLRFADAPQRFPYRDNYAQTYFLRVAQPNALFTGYGAGWVSLGTGEAARLVSDPRGYVQYLQEASTYRIFSPTPRLTPAALRDDVVDTSDERHLGLPPVPDRVRDLALSIVEGASSDFDKAARLERFLLTQYPYDLRVGPYPGDKDAVDQFLFEAQAGYCSQFATAMAVMARIVGLPTRVAVGYLPGRFESLAGVHAVTLQDAHAWVEVRFREHGWVPFDPTPAPNSPWAAGFGSSSIALGFQQALRDRMAGLFSVASAGVVAGLSGPLGGGSWLALPLAALAVAAVVLVALAVRRLGLRRRNSHEARPYGLLRDAEREAARRVYSRALRLLRRRGNPQRLPHQGMQEYLAEVTSEGSVAGDAFARITASASAASYDPRPFPGQRVEDARSALRGLEREGG